jgi:Toxin SymE, type I toxin-antitoxin system
MAHSHSKHNSVRVTDCAPAISSANRSKGLSSGRIGEVSQSYCPAAVISPLPIRPARTPLAPPQLRRWTVGYRHRYVEHRYTYPHAGRRRPEPPPVPFLPLQGRWLCQAGFTIGTSVRVLVTSGRLVLEVDEKTDAKPESCKTSK